MDVERVIRGLANDGVTIVIIEHTMHAMVRLVDRFLVLAHGAVLVEGTPAEVTRDPRVVEAYLGKKWASHAEGCEHAGGLLRRSGPRRRVERGRGGAVCVDRRPPRTRQDHPVRSEDGSGGKE